MHFVKTVKIAYVVWILRKGFHSCLRTPTLTYKLEAGPVQPSGCDNSPSNNEVQNTWSFNFMSRYAFMLFFSGLRIYNYFRLVISKCVVYTFNLQVWVCLCVYAGRDFSLMSTKTNSFRCSSQQHKLIRRAVRCWSYTQYSIWELEESFEFWKYWDGQNWCGEQVLVDASRPELCMHFSSL
jgi:hypothetical protein